MTRAFKLEPRSVPSLVGKREKSKSHSIQSWATDVPVWSAAIRVSIEANRYFFHLCRCFVSSQTNWYLLDGFFYSKLFVFYGGDRAPIYLGRKQTWAIWNDTSCILSVAVSYRSPNCCIVSVAVLHRVLYRVSYWVSYRVSYCSMTRYLVGRYVSPKSAV